jgi:hypothetical protein
MKLNSLLIPNVSVHRSNKGRAYVYIIFLPRKFYDFIQPSKYKIIVLYKEREIEVGVRKVYRDHKLYVLTLPKHLEYMWNNIITNKEKISIIIEKIEDDKR